jgi:hypothetical protein
MRHRTATAILVSTSLLGGVGGCVEQTMTITSKPSGALVYLNDDEFGRTPITRPFTYYGTYDVRVEHEGYEGLKTTGVVIAPWWNWVPLDLAAAILPLPLKDHQRLHYDLKPASTQPADEQALVERAKKLEKELPRPK